MVKSWSRAISAMLEEWEKLQALAETSRSNTVKGDGGKWGTKEQELGVA